MSEAGPLPLTYRQMRRERDRQLLEDLRHYGIEIRGLRLNWRKYPVGEGHEIQTVDGNYLESMSGITVEDRRGNVIAHGWTEWFYSTIDGVFFFWDLLALKENGEHRIIKYFGIPLHLWVTLSEGAKVEYVNSYEGGRQNEPWVIEWKQTRP